jgi:hypothetical protein
VFVVGLIWNILVIGRRLTEVPPFPVSQTIDDLWNILTSKFGIHIACCIGMLASGLVAAVSFIAMVVKG